MKLDTETIDRIGLWLVRLMFCGVACALLWRGDYLPVIIIGAAALLLFLFR